MRRGGDVMARAAINIGNTTEETVNIDEINPVPGNRISEFSQIS